MNPVNTQDTRKLASKVNRIMEPNSHSMSNIINTFISNSEIPKEDQQILIGSIKELIYAKECEIAQKIIGVGQAHLDRYNFSGK